jgi:adenine-specific DNA-methyltransferase
MAIDVQLGMPIGSAVPNAMRFPRLRYMGSKYRLADELSERFLDVGGRTALDAFSGSGFVSYLLKTLGYAVTSNDYLQFPSVISRAVVENHTDQLSPEDVAWICGPSLDGRDFIQATFAGMYFPAADLAFLDSAWSHIDQMTEPKRSLALAALVLAVARKQPRGVFTFSDQRYDDGRRDIRLSLREHFPERVAEYNQCVFDSGQISRSLSRDVFDVDPAGYDLVYLDPPYAPPRDDNDYIKRYHFLEGLSVYWEGMTIMHDTKTKKLEKRFTPFAYKRTIVDALERLFEKFSESAIILSYSSNAVPDAETIMALLRNVKGSVDMFPVDHSYSFGTHSKALRRDVSEYIFVAQ